MDDNQRDMCKAIAQLNDQMRKGFENHEAYDLGKFYYTQGVEYKIASMRDSDPDNALTKYHQFRKTIADFDDFTEDNDPYGERDFGKVKTNIGDVYFKIDYFDTDYNMGAQDPSDPETCRRVMTIMLPEEY